MVSTKSLSTGRVCCITAFAVTEEVHKIFRGGWTKNSYNSNKYPRNVKERMYWLLFRSVCLGGMFTVPLKTRYSLVSAASRLLWLLDRVCHCCSFSGKFGHGSSSMLDKALHTNMRACRRSICTHRDTPLIFFLVFTYWHCKSLGCVQFHCKKIFIRNVFNLLENNSNNYLPLGEVCGLDSPWL